MVDSVAQPFWPSRLARWAATLVVAFHVLAVLSKALAAPNGPWPGDYSERGEPPRFAWHLHQPFRGYLRALHLNHDFHFESNHLSNSLAAAIDVVVETPGGVEVKTTIPDPRAPLAVRAKQAALVRLIAEDQPVTAPSGEEIPAPGSRPRRVLYWKATPGDDAGSLALTSVLDIPRDSVYYAPTDRSLALARAIEQRYSRDGSKAIVVRRVRTPFPPALLGNMYDEKPPAAQFAEEVRRYVRESDMVEE